MDVVILCGGRGTRMREETEYRPKPMVAVGGQPLLWHIMRGFLHHGLDRFILCLGYKGEVIRDHFFDFEARSRDCTVRYDAAGRHVHYHGEPERRPFSVTLADTGLDTLTGGRIKRVEGHVTGDRFIVTYGDGLADVDFGRLVEFHRSHGRLATVTAVQPWSRFGLLSIDGASRVTRFAEKDRVEGWISAGFFVFERRVFDYLDGGDQQTLEAGPLERLAADGELMAYRHEGSFLAVDTPRDSALVNDLWDRGAAPWKVW